MSEKCRFAQLLLTEDQMRKINIRIAALPLIVLIFLSCPICLRAQVEKAAPYPAMALLDQYLIPDEKADLPLLAPGAMCYMMSKQQYLNDGAKSWHPHVMFLVAGDAEKSWGGNLPGSPIIAANNPEQRVTIFMVLANEWSDGTPGPSTAH